MIYEIPVAPISRRILLHDYEEEPIKPTRHDQLYHQLCYARDPHIETARLHSVLTGSIRIDIKQRVFEQRPDQLWIIGELIYRSHMDRMLHFVEAYTLATGNAWGAIELFYTKHEIEEDDFPLESAYKRWQRYQLGLHYSIREVGREARKIYPRIVQVPFTMEMCDDLYALALSRLHRHLYSYAGCFLLPTARALKAYIYRHYGQYPYEMIATALDITKGATNNQIKMGRQWLEGNKEAAFYLERLSYVVRQAVAKAS